MKKTDDIRTGSVRQWHPWMDQKGMPCPLGFYHDGWIFTGSNHQEIKVDTLEKLTSSITEKGLYVTCYDLLSEREIPFIDNLIGSKSFTPYLSRTGGIPASRIRGGKGQGGYLLPARTWKSDERPSKDFLYTLKWTFRATGFQSTTPASLSEKVLRASLPEKLHISRPSQALRKDILENHVGGRIDRAGRGPDGKYVLYRRAFEYDKNKAYAHFARRVPSPFAAPVVRNKTTLEDALSYAAGYWKCTMIAHGTGLQPIQHKGENYAQGGVFCRWLWNEELTDCLHATYELVGIERGYGWRECSDFMCGWSDALWTLYLKSSQESDHAKDIVKSMMVGLPGRFLRAPERYVLKHYTEQVKGDVPLPIKWEHEGDRMLSQWVAHPVPDPESTALAPIGSYIVAQMRSELYHLAKREEARGNPLLRSYIDSIAFEYRVEDIDLGPDMGQYKEREWVNVYAEENRMIAQEIDPYGWIDTPVMRAPGLPSVTKSTKRLELWKTYRERVNAG